jgi:hypothetical protein
MPFPILAAIGINAATQILGGKKASDAQKDAAASASALSNKVYDYTRQANAPYTNLGAQAAGTLSSMYGYGGSDPSQAAYGNSPFLQSDYLTLASLFPKVRSAANWNDINWSAIGGKPQMSEGVENFIASNWGAIRPAANFSDINWNAGTGWAGGTPIGGNKGQVNQPAPMSAPNYEAFFASPDYQFRQQQGMKNIGNYFGARGGAFSGNALKALTEYNSNLAAGEFGNWFNRQFDMMGAGQTANAQNANAGTNNASLAGNAMMARGDARASGLLNTTSALQNALYDGYGASRGTRTKRDNYDFWSTFGG